ncbi:MAG TPA: Smr/MutS family protein [Sphingomonas sp.]
MAREPLDPEARALWRRVTDTVRPLAGRAVKAASVEVPVAPRLPAPFAGKPPEPPKRISASHAGETLDGGWDRRLRRGIVSPDMTIDLHGHSLFAAQAALDAALARAIAGHARVLLVVTGRPPREPGERIDGRPVRGAIRAAIGDWLGSSRHTGQIAAVRNAHPRHGGAGALYVILRRRREPG